MVAIVEQAVINAMQPGEQLHGYTLEELDSNPLGNVSLYYFRTARLLQELLGPVTPTPPKNEYYVTDVVQNAVQRGGLRMVLHEVDPRLQADLTTLSNVAEVESVLRELEGRPAGLEEGNLEELARSALQGLQDLESELRVLSARLSMLQSEAILSGGRRRRVKGESGLVQHVARALNEAQKRKEVLISDWNHLAVLREGTPQREQAAATLASDARDALGWIEERRVHLTRWRERTAKKNLTQGGTDQAGLEENRAAEEPEERMRGVLAGLQWAKQDAGMALVGPEALSGSEGVPALAPLLLALKESRPAEEWAQIRQQVSAYSEDGVLAERLEAAGYRTARGIPELNKSLEDLAPPSVIFYMAGDDYLKRGDIPAVTDSILLTPENFLSQLARLLGLLGYVPLAPEKLEPLADALRESA